MYYDPFLFAGIFEQNIKKRHKKKTTTVEIYIGMGTYMILNPSTYRRYSIKKSLVVQNKTK